MSGWACADAAAARAPAEIKAASGAAGPSAAEDFVAWKSHMGVQVASSRVVRATAKGWGRSGTLSDALVTRHGEIEGFTAAIPSSPSSLFIGFTTLQSTLHIATRAHQDDLNFALRISADGSISYHSTQRAKQFYHAQQMESEAIGSLEKRDVIGMRLSPDKNGFSVFKVDRGEALPAAAGRPAAAAAGGRERLLKTFSEVLSFPMKVMAYSTYPSSPPLPPPPLSVLKTGRPAAAAAGGRERLLKTFSEVLSFPMKVMVVFGSSGAQVGPVCWLRRPTVVSKQSSHLNAAPARSGMNLLPPPPIIDAERVVKGRHAGELLDRGTVDDETGNVLLMRESGDGSWAAGVVHTVKPTGTSDDQKMCSDAAEFLGGGAVKKSLGGGSAQAGALSLLPSRAAKVGATAKEAARARAATAAALQPRAVGKGERLLPKSARSAPASAAAAGRGSEATGQGRSKRARDGGGSTASGEPEREVEGGSNTGEGHGLERGAGNGNAERRVPLSRAVWAMACLARHSPFLTESQRDAIAEMTELHRAASTRAREAAAAQPPRRAEAGAVADEGGDGEQTGRAEVRLSHVRLLLAAIEQLVPGAAPPRPPRMPRGDVDEWAPPPFFVV